MQNKITKYLKVKIFTLDECFKGQQNLFKIFIDPILKDHKVKLQNNIFNDYHILRLCRISDEISKFKKESQANIVYSCRYKQGSHFRYDIVRKFLQIRKCFKEMMYHFSLKSIDL